MSIGMLWNLPQYKTTTDKWGMLTRVTTWQTKTYSISRQTWKWTKNCFFTYWTLQYWTATFSLSLAAPNYPTEILDLDLLEKGGRVLQRQTTHREYQPLPSASQKCDIFSTGQIKGHSWCILFSIRSKYSKIRYKCLKCNVGSCIGPYFRIYPPPRQKCARTHSPPREKWITQS